MPEFPTLIIAQIVPNNIDLRTVSVHVKHIDFFIELLLSTLRGIHFFEPGKFQSNIMFLAVNLLDR